MQCILTYSCCHYTVGLLRSAVCFRSLFRLGLFRWTSHAGNTTTKVCSELYLWVHSLYGLICHSQRPHGSLEVSLCPRANTLYNHLLYEYLHDALSNLYLWRSFGICLGHGSIWLSAHGTLVVSHFLSAGRQCRTEHRLVGHVESLAACCEVPSSMHGAVL